MKSNDRLSSDPYLINKVMAAVAFGANSLPPEIPYWKELQGMVQRRGVLAGDISAIWDLFQNRGFHFEADSTVLDAHCEVPGKNPFGTVSEFCYLLMRGKLSYIHAECAYSCDPQAYLVISKGREEQPGVPGSGSAYLETKKILAQVGTSAQIVCFDCLGAVYHGPERSRYGRPSQ